MSEHPITAEKVCVLAVLVLLAGCAQKPEPTQEGGVRISDGGGAATAYSIQMPDGTRCVALVGYYKGAITCDWNDSRGIER